MQKIYFFYFVFVLFLFSLENLGFSPDICEKVEFNFFPKLSLISNTEDKDIEFFLYKTRRLVNVRLHTMFRPELNNILYLIVNQMTI